MAFHKKEVFGKKEQELAQFAKAISHPARIAILKVLARKQECICSDIVNELPLAQSTISQHLKELKGSGLVLGTAEGARSHYSINWKAFDKLTREMKVLFDRITDKAQKRSRM